MTHLANAEIAMMRSDAEGVELSMTCDVQRLTQTGTDPLGNPIMEWAPLHSGVECWYWQESDSEIVGDVNVTITTSRVKFPARTDITTADRIVGLVDRDGATLPMLGITAVVSRLTTVVATVERVS